jgi:hypothetical protein
MAFLAARPGRTTALAPDWLEGTVLVGQLTGDTFTHDLKMTHYLGQGTGDPHGRVLGVDGLKQGENLKLLGVA